MAIYFKVEAFFRQWRELLYQIINAWHYKRKDLLLIRSRSWKLFF